MRVTNYLKATALGLFIGLAGACTNEEFQNGLPDQTVNLKDGEMLVKMNVSGIGGTVATRANENITLPGEVEIGKLDLYCFVDLTAANPSAVTTTENDFTLERIYTYKALGEGNDLALTPIGEGYQASFGVPKDERKRIFVMIANDIKRTTALNAIRLESATGVGANRLAATKLSGLKAWNILETALYDTPANISTSLPMTAIAGRTILGTEGTLVFDNVYTPDDIKDGAVLKAELKRPISRIDVKNPASTGFTVTSVTLKGAKNSKLFFAANNSDVPAASGDYELVDFALKPITVSAEMIPAALYAYPVTAEVDVPTVTVKGKLGHGGEVEVIATFGNNMAVEKKGMMPNTRYIVNLHNSEGNITADITIAEWNAGETIDTDDAAVKLNANATLAVTDKSTLTERTLYIKFATNAYADATMDTDNKIATITGAVGDSKPIGIILPEGCDWLGVEDLKEVPAKYNLHVIKDNLTKRPRTATLSLVTYDDVEEKQKIQEFVIHQDYLDITKLTKEFPKPGEWNFITQYISADESDASGYVNTYKFSPFGINYVLQYLMGKTSELTEGLTEGYDIVIPEDCSWLTKESTFVDGGYWFFIGMQDNIGMQERRATLELRRWDNLKGLQTKKITIIQSGTVDKKLLSDVAQVILNPEAVSANLLRMEGNTIYLASEQAFADKGSDILNDGGQLISVRGGNDMESSGSIKPVWVNMETSLNQWQWLVVTGGTFNVAYSAYEVGFQYITNVSYENESRETSFTVTTYANGAPVVNTYRIIQVKSGAGLDDASQGKQDEGQGEGEQEQGKS